MYVDKNIDHSRKGLRDEGVINTSTLHDGLRLFCDGADVWLIITHRCTLALSHFH